MRVPRVCGPADCSAEEYIQWELHQDAPSAVHNTSPPRSDDFCYNIAAVSCDIIHGADIKLLILYRSYLYIYVFISH